MPRPPASDLTQTGAYKPELIEFALAVYADEGNAKRTARMVKDKFGAGPSAATIAKWAREDYNDLYMRVREQITEKIKARVAIDFEDELREGLAVQSKARQRLAKEIDTLDARDVPGALRNAATANAILADKLQQMRGGQQITVNHELNADELLGKLARILPSGVATNVVDAVEVAELPQGLGQDESSEAVSGA